MREAVYVTGPPTLAITFLWTIYYFLRKKTPRRNGRTDNLLASRVD